MLGIIAQTTSEFTTTYNTTSTEDAGIAFGTIFLIFIIAYLITAFISSFVFKKAGRPMWAAYVPIYNSWVLFEIAGKPGWWSLVNLIPFVGAIIYLVLYIIAALELAKRFAKGPLFAILGLIIFPLIGLIILAFDKSTYAAAGGESQAAFTPVTPVADTTSFAEPTVVPQPPADQPLDPVVPPAPQQPQPPVNPPVEPADDNNGTPPTPPAGPVVQ